MGDSVTHFQRDYTMPDLDRTGCPLIASHAAGDTEVWGMPPQARREATRPMFRADRAATRVQETAA